MTQFTRKEIEVLWCALADAISDRQEFVRAYTLPSYRKADVEFARTRRKAVAQVKRYEKLRKKIGTILTRAGEKKE